ncbi:hypothetical protein D9M68_666050 [compost metagenome]
MQRALDGLGIRRGLRLLGHHRLGRCSHHGADVGGFGLRLATALDQILGAQVVGLLDLGLLVGQHTGGRFALQRRGLGFFVLGDAGCSAASGIDRGRCGLNGFAFGARRGLGRFGSHPILFGFGRAGFFGFALLAFQQQLFFLATQQLGLVACIFFTTGQFGLIDDGDCRRLWLGHDFRCDHIVVALDEGALLAHLDLDRAGTTGGVGLLDFAGRFLDQRDFLAFTARGAMAGLEVAQQLLLVRLGDRVGSRVFGHPGRGELLQQR